MSTDITPQEGTNPEPEVVIDTEAEETSETPSEHKEEVVPKSQFNQVYARAKKAEADLKAFMEKSQANAQTNINNSSLSAEDVEAKILISQGMPNELLEELKTISKVRGKSLLETQADPIFVALKNNYEAEKKAEKAQLGASKGSGSVKKAKSINTPGLSDSEHKELWKQKMGR